MVWPDFSKTGLKIYDFLQQAKNGKKFNFWQTVSKGKNWPLKQPNVNHLREGIDWRKVGETQLNKKHKKT